MKNSFTFSSNPIRLSWKEWLIVMAILIVVVCALPRIWQRVEKLDPSVLFSVELKYQIDLENGEISEELRQEFMNNWLLLSENATVSTEQESAHWLITDRELLFGISIEQNLKIPLIPSERKTVSVLTEDGTISEDMRYEFENSGVSLSQDVTILVESPDNQWRVVDGNMQYLIRREKDGLSIYDEGNKRTYSVKIGKNRLNVYGLLADYRLPYILGDDYWVFERWSEYARSKYPIVVIGDSVIWGQYVTREQTLSHYLNEQAGEEIFANLGVDGTHPAAILGLVRYYGKAISDKQVILHLNPLWMSSKKHDLSDEEEFSFNHPRLVPQFIGKPDCYRASSSQRVGVVAERSISFLKWSSHMRTVSLENMDLQNWTMLYPYRNPLKAVTLELSIPENRPRSRRGKMRMEKSDFPWVQPEESFQWECFREVIRVLKKRNNQIFVIIGPFNPYILTEESLIRYNSVKREMEEVLEGEGIEYKSLSDLPRIYYGDASHPLKEGYAKIAEELFGTGPFQKWMRRYGSGGVQ